MKKITLLLLGFPLLTFAQITGNSNFKDVVYFFLDLINTAIPVVASLALLAFFWGLVKFIYKSGDAKTHAEGRNLMIWGIIALFVMVSLWGIIRFFQSDLGFSRPFGIPLLPTSNSAPNTNGGTNTSLQNTCGDNPLQSPCR